MKIVDLDVNNKISLSNQVEASSKSDMKNGNNSGYTAIKGNLEGQTRTIQYSKSCSKKIVIKEKDGEYIELWIPTDPRNAELWRVRLWNKNRVDCSKLANPKVNRRIQLLIKSRIPEHVDKALNSDIKSHEIKFLFNCINKIYNQETLISNQDSHLQESIAY